VHNTAVGQCKFSAAKHHLFTVTTAGYAFLSAMNKCLHAGPIKICTSGGGSVSHTCDGGITVMKIAACVVHLSLTRTDRSQMVPNPEYTVVW
jgi:hypothetical protein